MNVKHSRFYQTIIAIAMTLIGSLPSLAHDFEVDGIYYYLDESAKTVAVTCKGDYWHGGLGSYSGSVTIPSYVRYNGVTYSVTSISGFAFSLQIKVYWFLSKLDKSKSLKFFFIAKELYTLLSFLYMSFLNL